MNYFYFGARPCRCCCCCKNKCLNKIDFIFLNTESSHLYKMRWREWSLVKHSKIGGEDKMSTILVVIFDYVTSIENAIRQKFHQWFLIILSLFFHRHSEMYVYNYLSTENWRPKMTFNMLTPIQVLLIFLGFWSTKLLSTVLLLAHTSTLRKTMNIKWIFGTNSANFTLSYAISHFIANMKYHVIVRIATLSPSLPLFFFFHSFIFCVIFNGMKIKPPQHCVLCRNEKKSIKSQ